jgi:Uma2 family endonuclease
MATATLHSSDLSTEHLDRTPYRMTAEQYFRAIEADVFPPDHRIELWDGRIYEKMAKKKPHFVSSTKVAGALFRWLPAGWTPWLENPILLNDFTAPLPDAAVVRGHADDYMVRGAPKAEDIGLVIELADSSLRKDFTKTLSVYARAGIPCYWVVNLVARKIHVFSKPRIEGETASYELAEVFEPGQDVPLVLDDREVARIPVRDLLPGEEPR